MNISSSHQFSRSFAQTLGAELVGLLLDKMEASVSDEDWAGIFTRCMGSECQTDAENPVVFCPSASAMWFTKVLLNYRPFCVCHVNLTWHEMCPNCFFQENAAVSEAEIGAKVLEIWNTRVEEVRTRFSNVRTVVLLKGDNLTTVSVYEEDTVQFLPEHYYWQWNERGNLEGYEKATAVHRFTWQPHGSQFTIVSDVPDNRLKLRIRKPPVVSQTAVLASVKYDDSWIEIVP